MTDQLVLRPATLADEPDVVDLWRRCGLTADHNPPEADYRRALGGPASTVILAILGDRIIGSVMVGEDGHRAWIYYLAADPDHRRAGIGARLTRAAEAWAAARGVRKIQLMIRPTNAGVRRVYDAVGYGETPRLVMAKWLDKDVAANPPEA